MPSPNTSSLASQVNNSEETNIDALLGGVRWGQGTGKTTISFSFPWANGANAYFSGYGGAAYSANDEPSANTHLGLTPVAQNAARRALETWANVANILFVESEDNQTTVGDIRFAFTSAENIASFWGAAYLPNNYWPNGGDVWISSAFSQSTNWADGTYNFEALIHEIGHALGLEHPFSGPVILPSGLENRLYTVMSYTEPPKSIYPQVGMVNGTRDWVTYYVVPETPMVLDVLAIQYIYGPNMSYHASNDRYTFSSTTPFFKTLWDAGGEDTISLTNFSTDCRLDLTPGAYSTLSFDPPSDSGGITPTYDGSNNLGIAYGTVIENATGGSGADILIGNQANNHLNGGSGNDIMYGGECNDIFDADITERAGADLFYGGKGDDVYYLDTPLDNVVEYAGEGNDTVVVNASYTLSGQEDVENLIASSASTAVRLTGNGADNTLHGSRFSDAIEGGGGRDLVVYAGVRTSYTISVTEGGVTVNSSIDGDDVLSEVERIRFADGSLAFDLSKGANAANAAELIGALAFGALHDPATAATVLSVFDSGVTMTQACALAVSSGLTASLARSASDVDLVRLLFRNIVGGEADSSTARQLASLMKGSGGNLSQPEFLALATDLALNDQHIDLIGLQKTGFAYL